VGDWRLLSNHGLALVCVAEQPGVRLREVADCVGVTERAAHRIVSDLCEAGFITRHRSGRRNYYEIQPDAPLGHPLLSGHNVGELLAAVADAPAEEPEAGLTTPRPLHAGGRPRARAPARR
jgi:DNA-binding IclR family transcriptional regulator